MLDMLESSVVGGGGVGGWLEENEEKGSSSVVTRFGGNWRLLAARARLSPLSSPDFFRPSTPTDNALKGANTHRDLLKAEPLSLYPLILTQTGGTSGAALARARTSSFPLARIL